jgi:hypothetical protein
MSEVQIAWVLTGAGGLFALVSGLVVIRRFFFSLRAVTTEGTVTGLDPGSSGDFPIVSFTPEGHAVAGGRVVTFRSSSTAGANAIGQKVRVYYDPNRPENASLVSSSFVYIVALMIGVFGAGTCWAVAAMLGLWLGPAIEGRDAGVARFLAAVEHGDPSAIRAAAAEDAELDYRFLAQLRGISGFDEGNSTLNTEDSCIRGMIGAHQITMKLVVRNGEWRVLRAANTDPQECDEDLSGI